jgi:DMSO reductase anchor subunit
MELIRPMKQKVWGWPAVVNFTLGGMATGFYLLSFPIVILPNSVLGPFESALFKLLPPVLVGLGFLVLTIEAGRPLRSYHLLRHLRRSWMSRETLAAIIFIPVTIVDWFLPHPALWGLAAVAAIGLMISQGFIIYRCRAVTAWNMPLIPYLFLTSSFVAGSGLLLLLSLDELALERRGPIVIGLVCVGLNLGMWLLYLSWSQEPAFQEAIGILRQAKSLILIVGIGHLLPFVLLLLVIFDIDFELQRIMIALAGLAIIIAGVSQKTSIILEAGYLRGIELGQPQPNIRSVSQTFVASPLIRRGNTH